MVGNGPGIGDTAAPPSAGNDGGNASHMFTKLLVAQIKNQDPLAPMEAGQFVTQFAQMSQVEAMQTLANLGSTAAAMQESMLVVTLGSQVGSLVRVRADAVELNDTVVKGGFTLESSASSVDVILTGPDGTEHTIALGARQAGDVDVDLDPDAHGLPPGRYALRVVADSGEKPGIELTGELQGVRVGAAGRVILAVAGVGDADTTDITRFLGRPNAAVTPPDATRPQILPISKRFQS
ncbi:flagellar hook capping FlgD N-terminal domain-containing protein [Burkholderia sp. BCC0044]|uniref:flagellar hook capping FlgD N-terminal domain-containing protein n=1 Tax=Burkholderia sp. BCC0044 TaxID=2676295 RepID=UPI001FC820BD|nr:flagellar hook capping FlgD N-terminal domain-containing protein [Burkholderia sp. BCC0044]